MLDFIKSMTSTPAEAVGELAEQARSWLTLGLAVVGFSLKPAVQEDQQPAKRPARRTDVIAALPAPIDIPSPDADAEVAVVHMTRVCRVVNASLASAERIVARHAASAVSLDAAEYALNSLLDELKGAMAPPIALAARAPRPMPQRPCLSTDLSALAA